MARTCAVELFIGDGSRSADLFDMSSHTYPLIELDKCYSSFTIFTTYSTGKRSGFGWRQTQVSQTSEDREDTAFRLGQDKKNALSLEAGAWKTV